MPMNLAVVALCAIAAVVQSPRWLRVAQREHYLPGSVTRFAVRWWSASPANLALGLAAVTGALAGFALAPMGAVSAAVTVVAPMGLTLRGRTSKLVWTRRLKTLAAVAGIVDLVLFVVAALAGERGDAGPALAALLCFLQPVVIDAGLALTRPFEQ